MKKHIAVCALVLGLGATAPAFATENKTLEKKQPVKMTEEQLDKVAGGQLVQIIAVDVVDVTTGDILRTVNVPVNAAIAVLGNGVAGQRFNFVPRP